MRYTPPPNLSMPIPAVLYRYDTSYHSESQLRLHCAQYYIIKTTPCGYWIDVYGRKRFVLAQAHKHYACLTKEDALASFYARKDRQIRILRARLREAQLARTLIPGEQEIGYIDGE